jgi:hypothetical protein
MAGQYNLEFDIPTNGHLRKATVTVIDKEENVQLTDKLDMQSFNERRKFGNRLVGLLPNLDQEEVQKQIEETWNLTIQRRRDEQQCNQAQAQANASDESNVPEPDPDEEERQRLAATPPHIRQEAENMLRQRCLIDRISEDIALLGVAGEKELALTLYLVYTSRKLTHPLAARVRGPSTSGKSHVIERTAKLIPPESVILATQMTPQALFYMERGSLRHKLIVAGERSRNQSDDAAEATRALREMISTGRLTKLLPMKVGDRLQTMLVEQDGPIAIVESTTLNEVFAEDENRALPLYTDERPEQTRRIITALANRSMGQAICGRDAAHIQLVHHAAQRLLECLQVCIPFAQTLGKALPEQRIEVRRAFGSLLSMIHASVLLHQFQRERTADGLVIATKDDYALAAYLLAVAMRRLMGGGLSEPARRFAERLSRWFQGKTFTASEAIAKEVTSRSSVYGWFNELRTAGVLVLVSEAHGRAPATWRFAAADLSQAVAAVLPPVEVVFQGDDR